MATKLQSIQAIVNHDDDYPLNTRFITFNENGIQRKVAALHDMWKDGRCFTRYTGLKIVDEEVVEDASLEQWLNETEWYVKDMKHLKNMELHRFWSTIVYNPSAMESVVSFMQTALPSYLAPALKTVENEHVVSVYKTAYVHVFDVIRRLGRIEGDFFGELIYKDFIITVPFLLDMISIYGQDNKEDVSVIIDWAMRIQPKYKIDFKQGLTYMMSAFVSLQARCESELMEPNVSESTLNDLAMHVQDCSSILVQLVMFPTLVEICSELDVQVAISNFYDNVVIMLYRSIQETNKHSRYLTYLNDIRVQLLDTFNDISSVQLHMMSRHGDNSLLVVDKYISILTECLSNSVFVDDYKTIHSVELFLTHAEYAYSQYNSMDRVKFEFIRQAYAKNDTKEVDPLPEPEYEAKIPEEEQIADEPMNEAHVQYITELLPHMEIDHVRKVLFSCKNVERAVIVLLEESNVPSAISQPPGPDEVVIPSDPLDEFYLRTGIDRLNIYDGDELDVMVNDKVKGVIKKGKGMPGQPRTLTELLDDKSHIHHTRQFYRQFDLIAEHHDDDEYDDSFEAMVESESRHIKLAKGAHNTLIDEAIDGDSESENDNGSETEQESTHKPELAFCENPEVARKRYEERLNSKLLRRHGSAGTKAKESKDADVRGKPKGQGQDNKVLLNRKHKNENKATSGNHNRKQGASYKRNRGM